MSMAEINDELCFCYENGNSQKRQEAYEFYKQNNPGSFDDWGYDNQTIIFLDTNILLGAYALSKLEKKALVKFIENNKKRIVIASQVDKEYQKHRLELISSYDKKLTQLNKDTKGVIGTCLKSLNGEAIGMIKSLSGNHLLKYDFSEEYQALKKILDDMQTYHDCLKEDRDKISSSLMAFQENLSRSLQPGSTDVANMYMEDELLQAVAQCIILPSLADSEIEYIKKKYAECLEVFNKNKTATIGRYRFAFPGCGDRKKDETEGRFKESDMVIYHEMLKFLQEKDKNVIFLTFDITKSDWAPGKEYNGAFLHYIENQYVKTGHVIYIKSGEELPLMFDNETELEDEDSDNEEASYELISLEDVDLFGDICKSDNLNSKNETCENVESSQSINDNENCTPRRGFRKIDSERFMSELHKSTKWAEEYGAGFVGRDYFIYGLLGRQKHFEFNQSRLVYKSLIDSGKIKEEVGENGDEIIVLSN